MLAQVYHAYRALSDVMLETDKPVPERSRRRRALAGVRIETNYYIPKYTLFTLVAP